MALVSRFIHEEAGQDLIEYALLAAFISVAAVAAISTIGTVLDQSRQNSSRMGSTSVSIW